MKLTASGATDRAHMVLFWCDNMPEDFKGHMVPDSINFSNSLEREGKLLQFPMNDDGDYTVIIYVNDQVEDYLKGFLKLKSSMESLLVSGDGYFGGGEFMTNDHREMAAGNHMCEKVVIPNGCYQVSIYEVDTPQDHDVEWVQAHCTEYEMKVGDRAEALMAISILMILVGLVSFLVLSWMYSLGIIIIAILLMLRGVMLMGKNEYKKYSDRCNEYNERFPSCVVTFSSVSD